MKRSTSVVASACLVTVAVGSGCGGGRLEISTRGSAATEDGLATTAFVDDGHATLTKLLVVLDDLTFAGSEGEVGGVVAEPGVWNVREAGQHGIERFDTVDRAWERLSAVVGPAADAAAGNVEAADLELMTSQGFSVFVEGTVGTGSGADVVDKRFAWGFSTNTRHRDCVQEDGTAGVVVPAGGTASWELTIHGERLFGSSLAAPVVGEDPALRVAALVAADDNDDGAIDVDELAGVEIDTLPDYDTGLATDVQTLGDFVAALTRTLVGHTGDGVCVAERR